MTRRDEMAAANRRAILDAARHFFAERGYFDTRIEDIARRAGVGRASVFAVGGGKRGLLNSLFEDAGSRRHWTGFQAEIDGARDGPAVIDVIVTATVDVFEEWGPLLRQVIAAAAREPSIRESLAIANRAQRLGHRAAAERLGALGALRPGVSVDRAHDVFFLELGNVAHIVRADDLGWSTDESRAWLVDALGRELLA